MISINIDRQSGIGRPTAEIIEDLLKRPEVSLKLVTGSLKDLRPETVEKVEVTLLPKPKRVNLASGLVFLITSSIYLFLHRRFARKKWLYHSQAFGTIGADIYTAHFCEAERQRLLREKRYSYPRGGFTYTAKKLHDFLYHRLALSIERWTLKSLKMRGGWIIAPSRGIRKNLIDHYGVDPEKIRIIPYSIDTEKFHPRNRELFRRPVRDALGFGEDEIIFLFVGSDWARKGLVHLIEAAARVRGPFRVLVIGRDYPHSYQGLLEKNGLAEKFIFRDHTDTIAQYYSASDVLILPSHFEVLPNVMLEAVASGLPSICARINGTPDVIEEGITGFLVDHREDHIAARMEHFIMNPGEIRHMGDRARRSLEGEKFCRATICSKTTEIYGTIWQGSPHRLSSYSKAQANQSWLLNHGTKKY